MPFHFEFSVDHVEAITVPYCSITDSIRRNRGFIDLRREPERAAEIEECRESHALMDFIKRAAAIDSPIFTLGCDLGVHTEPVGVSRRRREVAGGYVQISRVDYYATNTDDYAALANTIVDGLRARCASDNWRISLLGKWVNFQFEDEATGIYPSLWIWFYAAAADRAEALKSRERLISSLSDVLPCRK